MFGNLTRVAHLTAAGLASEPAVCESAAYGLPGVAAAGERGPGAAEASARDSAGIRAAPGRRESYSEDWLQTELRQREIAASCPAAVG